MKKEQVLSIDKKHIWHPFTQMKEFENKDHLVIVKGKGIMITDIDNKRYYDTISSWWTNIHGHSNPRINRALINQAKKNEHINFSGFTHPAAAELVQRLTKYLNEDLTRFFFSDDGSTACEVALKLAFQYWQNQGRKEKTKFVYLDNSYHGDTIGAVSVGGIDAFHKLYNPLKFESFRVNSPNCSKCEFRKTDYTFDASYTGCNYQCFKNMEETLEKNQDSIAAVIIEPLVQCAGGIITYSPEYLRKLRVLCDDLDIILIFDEVATGFGRTGRMFAYEKSDTIPDIICLSKGLTAGYMPMALTVTTDKIYKAFYDDYKANKTFYHGHSYTANPLACACGIESLKIFKETQTLKKAHPVMEYFNLRLSKLSRYDFVGDIRYNGFIGAIDIVKSRKNNKKFHPDLRIGNLIYKRSLENGIVLRPLGDTIYWFLPLITTKRDINAIINRSIKAIKEAIKDGEKRFIFDDDIGGNEQTDANWSV